MSEPSAPTLIPGSAEGSKSIGGVVIGLDLDLAERVAPAGERFVRVAGVGDYRLGDDDVLLGHEEGDDFRDLRSRTRSRPGTPGP